MPLQDNKRGFTLLEVVVSLSLLAILLVGLDVVQANVVKQARTAQSTDKARQTSAANLTYQFAHASDAPQTLPNAWKSAVAAVSPSCTSSADGKSGCYPVPV